MRKKKSVRIDPEWWKLTEDTVEHLREIFGSPVSLYETVEFIKLVHSMSKPKQKEKVQKGYEEAYSDYVDELEDMDESEEVTPDDVDYIG